ncbi:MAG: glycosyltransferase [Bacteroidia bacterium]
MQVSVIMAVYREPEDWLRKAIDSILRQTFRDFELLLILDDPTNDALRDVVAQYAVQDRRVKVFPNAENRGLARSLNRGLEAAQGRYIARMDGDDIAFPDRLEKQFAFMEANPEIALSGAWTSRINEVGEGIGQSRFFDKADLLKDLIPYRTVLSHPTWFGRKEVFDKMGGYRPFPAAQDYDMAYRLLDAGYSLSNLQEPLLYYRMNPNSITNKRTYVQRVCVEYIREMHAQRAQNGSDQFSEDELLQRIKDGNHRKENLEKSQGFFLKAMQAKGNRRPFSMLWFLLKSWFASDLQRAYFRGLLAGKWIIRRKA